MAVGVLIYGPSGTGKSTAIENLPKNKSLLINVIGKPLPFRDKFPHTWVSDDINKIIAAMNKTPDDIDKIVIDDAGYLMTNQFLRGHSGD